MPSREVLPQRRRWSPGGMPQWSSMVCWTASTSVSPKHLISKVCPFSATCTSSFCPRGTAVTSSSAPPPVTADPELIFPAIQLQQSDPLLLFPSLFCFTQFRLNLQFHHIPPNEATTGRAQFNTKHQTL